MFDVCVFIFTNDHHINCLVMSFFDYLAIWKRELFDMLHTCFFGTQSGSHKFIVVEVE